MKHNPIWFVQLSGWPVFLTIIGLVIILMLTLSVAMTWLGNRSVAMSVLYAVLFLACVVFGTLAVVAYFAN